MPEPEPDPLEPDPPVFVRLGPFHAGVADVGATVNIPIMLVEKNNVFASTMINESPATKLPAGLPLDSGIFFFVKTSFEGPRGLITTGEEDGWAGGGS